MFELLAEDVQRVFQSPIHRGMDCNTGFNSKVWGEDFQSPIHRGMDCNAYLLR